MITIIHGDDIAASRIYFLDKKKDRDIQILDGEKITLSDLVESIEGSELFFLKDKALFIEDFVSKRKPSKEVEEIIVYLKKSSSKIDAYLWEGKELSKKQISQFGTAITIKTFKIPQTTFVFLDSIRPGNGKKLVQLFHQTLQTSDEEFIFYMFVRQFRLLLALSDQNSADEIDEVKRLAPWQESKLSSQAKNFSKEKLVEIYQKIYKIDLAQKTGALSMPLSPTIDFLLLDI